MDVYGVLVLVYLYGVNAAQCNIQCTRIEENKNIILVYMSRDRGCTWLFI